MLYPELVRVELSKNAIEALLLQAKSIAAQLVDCDDASDEEMRLFLAAACVRLFLAAACVRLGLVPGEPEAE